MKTRAALALLLFALFGLSIPAMAQAPRQDAIWARRSLTPITLDGKLNEPGWAKAESTLLVFGKDTGIPGSGWKVEGGFLPTDSTKAYVKLLTYGNELYLGVVVPDKSIGGSKDFNRHDGLLMAIKDHANGLFPKPPSEYLYSWWFPDSTTLTPGVMPDFRGRWGIDTLGVRDSADVANWDAVTVVKGRTNSDAVPDTSWTVEMRFNLTPMGYDITTPEGDVVEWNISIYDCDWLWPMVFQLSYNRVWWQSPWGNQSWFDEVHVFARPSVTVNSGPAPYLPPEVYIPEGIGYTAPTIDGSLTEPVWSAVDGFDIRFSDETLRASYPGVGPVRSGEYQVGLPWGTATVLDPGDASVKLFFKGTKLYMGFDVRDEVVQDHPNFDRWDGFLVSINDRAVRGTEDHHLLGRRLTFHVTQAGGASPQDYLAQMVTAGTAQIALHLNTGTTVDTIGADVDNGYTAEMSLDLTALGYPADLGDQAIFIGVNLLDGDSYDPYTFSYGTRTWWFRQYENECCPAWAHLANTPVTGVEDPGLKPALNYTLLGAFPNPASRSTIRYTLAASSRVTFEMFDVAGRMIEQRSLGIEPAGLRELPYDGTGGTAGIYFYRLKVADPQSGLVRAVLNGRMILVN
jgi:hypothetical protein